MRNHHVFTRRLRTNSSLLFHRGFALLCFPLLIHAARAQNVITPPPAIPVTPSAVQENETNSPMEVFTPSDTAPHFRNTTQPFQWGSFVMRPHFLYRFLYGNGVDSSPGQQQNTIIQEVSPGVLFDFGSHWALDYTPTLNFYSSSGFRNTLDQSVQLSWGTAYNDWFFSGSQSFASTSDPQIQTAAQTDQQTYSTSLSASYQFNSKISLDLGANQNFNYVGNGPTNYLLSLASSRSWSTMEWLNYIYAPRLNFGLGIGGGYDQQDNSPDAVNEQYEARVNWRATDKISFQLSGGLQDQQYLGDGAGDLLAPIFGASIQYQPFDQTHVSISASRSVSESYFENQVTENTSVAGDLNQRLLGKLYLDLSGGYGSSKYIASVFGLSTGRTDNNYNLSARLTSPFLKRGTLAVFYSYSSDSSTQSGFLAPGSSFSYTSRQIGVELGFSY